MSEALFRRIDCLRIPVSDLDEALHFYGDALGHELIWRTDREMGLRMPETDAELVLYTDSSELETDLVVQDVASAVDRMIAHGATVLHPPFDIDIGRCAVVSDPFGNRIVILDSSKGKYVVDQSGTVQGVE